MMIGRQGRPFTASTTTTTTTTTTPNASLSSHVMKSRSRIILHAMSVIVVVAVTVNVAFFATLDNHHHHQHHHHHDSNNNNNDNMMIPSKMTKLPVVSGGSSSAEVRLRKTLNSSTTTMSSRNTATTGGNATTTAFTDGSVKSTTNNNNIINNRQRILDTFLEAGVTLTDEELVALPTWDDITRVVGTTGGPILYNPDDSCATYRNRIVAVERNIGCSGMFNSGTNLVTQLLKANCVIPERVEQYGWEGPFRDPKTGKSIGPGEAHGIRWQVPWGKHMPANFRDEHATKWAKEIWKESVLAVVTIRHPYAWFASMCKNNYAAKWPHNVDRGLCPHLRDDTKEDQPLVPVEVKYDGNVVHHDSLAHLWNDWYAQYLQKADFPYIVVRFEDLQFYAKNVTHQICECAGGEIRKDRPFKYIVDSAKDGPGHGKKEERTGMLAAWKKYGKPMPPQNGFGSLDYKTAVQYLNADFMDMFGYKHPEPNLAD